MGGGGRRRNGDGDGGWGMGKMGKSRLTSLGVPHHSTKGPSPKTGAGGHRAQEVGSPHEELTVRTLRGGWGAVLYMTMYSRATSARYL